MSEGTNLRQRLRSNMRDEAAAVAVALFAERGFDEVTVDDVAAAVGISPRSFFRYFATKEEPVLLKLRESGQRVAQALRERPKSEPAWEALRMSLRVIVQDPVFPEAQLLETVRLIVSTPAIRTRMSAVHEEWVDALLPEIVRRMPSQRGNGLGNDIRARALILTQLVCMDVATEAWVDAEGRVDPLALMDQLLHTVRGR